MVEVVFATVDHSDIRGSKPHDRDPSGAASEYKRGALAQAVRDAALEESDLLNHIEKLLRERNVRELDPMRVRPVSGYPNVCELAERVNVQGLVLDDENTVVEHKLAGQRAQVRNQEGC